MLLIVSCAISGGSCPSPPPSLRLPLPSPNFIWTSDVAIILQAYYMPQISHIVEYQTGAVIQMLLQVSYIHRDIFFKGFWLSDSDLIIFEF